MQDRAEVNAGFKAAMRRLAATVTVISLNSGGERHGMTATAVTSVSVDPPSLLICVNRVGRLHDMLMSTESFCVNILHAEHAEISRTFAQPHSDQRFACGDWELNERGLPFLRDAQAALFCRKAMTVPYASHSIIIGEVEDVRIRSEVVPLIYQDGHYGVHGPLQQAIGHDRSH